jgi:hypothetical protein
MDRRVRAQATAVPNLLPLGHAQASPIVRHQHQSLPQPTQLCTPSGAISVLGDGAVPVMEGHQNPYLKGHTRLGTICGQSVQRTAVQATVEPHVANLYV